jgi:exopolyphosphatase/pppGpp-phosphohydrolase
VEGCAGQASIASAQAGHAMPVIESLLPRLQGSTEQPQTLLDIGAWHTVVVASGGNATDALLELPIGARRTAEEFFRHDPPRPAELEAAIDAVEDQAMRMAGQLPKGSSLRVSGSFAGEIRHAVATDKHANVVVTLDEVEQLFQRLASASLGNPAARQGLPSGNSFVAAVLILREFMHHLGFTSVMFRADSD